MQTPFTRRDNATVIEVFAQFDMNPKRLELAWSIMDQRWKDADGRFYTYMTACNVAALVNFVGYPKPQL